MIQLKTITKYYLFLIVQILFAHSVIAQFSEEKIISACEVCHAINVFSIDLDGDKDVLFASRYDNKIAWYANDGSGNFSEQHVISIQADGAESVFATDLDGDGDMDVLSASGKDDKIAWYENY